MKKKFTKLTAALALLALFILPLTGWGQSAVVTFDASKDVTNATHTAYTNTLTTFNCNDGSIWKAIGFQETQYTWIGPGNGSGNYLETPEVNGTISSIAVTWSGNANYYLALKTTSGTELEAKSNPSSSSTETFNVSNYEGTYNQLRLVGRRSSGTSNALAMIEKVVVTYTPSSSAPTYSVTYDANGGTGTMTDPNSPYEANTNVTLLTNNFTAPEGKKWDSWLVKDASDNTIQVSNNSFTMPASNVTVTAQWAVDPSAPQYEWVLTDLASLTSTDIFVIVGTVSNTSYSMSNNSTSNPVASAVTIENSKITSTIADNLKWNISGNTTDGYTFYPNGSTTTWLYCNTTANSGSNTNLRVGGGNNATRKLFVPDGTTLKTKDTNIARYWNVYSSGPDWRGYTSNSTSTTVTFYKRQIVTNDPSISATNPEELAYNAPSGNISYTINNYVSNGAISANTEATWITNFTYTQGASGTVSFSTETNPSANQRSATVTLTYTYNTNQTVTKNVTVTQAGNPTIVDNISSITGENQSLAVKGSIVAISTRGFVIGDNTGYVYYYKGSGFTTTHSIGDVVKLTGTTDSYNHVIQFPDGTAIEDATGSFSAPAITVVDANNIAPYSEGLHLSDYVQIQGTLTKSTSNNNTYYNIAIEGVTNTASISYPTDAQAAELDALENKAVIVKGYFAGVSSGHFNAIMASVEELLTPTISVTPATVNAPFAETDGTLTVTYTAIETSVGASIYWFTDETCATQINEPAWIAAEINSSLNVEYTIAANTGDARTAYMKVYGVDSGANDVYSNLVTFNQAKYVAEYATLPFSFDGGRDDIPNTSGLTQENIGTDYGSSPKLKFEKGNKDNDGLYSTLVLKFNERPGTLTFDIKGNSFSGGTFKVQTSEDGTTYTDLSTYTETELDGTQNELFDNLGENVRYIKWIYTQKVNGNVALGNISLTKYVNPALIASITVNPDEVNAPATPQPGETWIEGTLDITYANLTINDMQDFAIQFYNANNEELNGSDEPDWIAVDVAEQDPAIGEGYVVSYVIDENSGEARTAYFKIAAFDANNELVYSNLVTISQAKYVAPATGVAYALYTGELVEGDYLIVYDGVAMNNTVTSDRFQYETISATNNIIVTDNDELVWHIAPSGSYWTIYSADANAYAASTGVKSKAQLLADGTDDMALWTIDGTYDFVNKQNTSAGVNATLRYNSGFGFACYSTSTGGALKLYKKMTLDIAHYTGNTNGWYLIASPVATTPADVENMIPASAEQGYDLYRFNQSNVNNKQWENYKNYPTSFDIVPGQGYLYANSQDVTLGFIGTAYTGNGTFALTYDNNAVAPETKGVNLVGNPFGTTASVDREFYVMNADGNGIEAAATGRKVNPMEGIFVIAESTETNPTVTFTQASQSTGSNNSSSSVVMNLTQNRGSVVDRAIVRFGSNSSLPKFQLFENSTKLYMAQDGKDYAVVSAEAQGEMPVCFKASVNGSYTLSVDAENVEMGYLHLIDNLTGMDVDLLATPSYSFEAKTSDYASRFRLVFSANNIAESNSENFAFFSDGQLIVTGLTGNETLQLIDALGRILVSTNATERVATDGMTPGVYVVRLVNGSDVKTQKIVVK